MRPAATAFQELDQMFYKWIPIHHVSTYFFYKWMPIHYFNYNIYTYVPKIFKENRWRSCLGIHKYHHPRIQELCSTDFAWNPGNPWDTTGTIRSSHLVTWNPWDPLLPPNQSPPPFTKRTPNTKNSGPR